MRTTVDLPDDLYRKTKAAAALRGTSMRDLIIQALERSVTEPPPAQPGAPKRFENFPFIHLKHTKKLDLSNFDFDDLLA